MGTIPFKREYRWENKRISQGHYYVSLEACIEDAKKASSEEGWESDLIEVTYHHPKELRGVVITGFEDGYEVNPPEDAPEVD